MLITWRTDWELELGSVVLLKKTASRKTDERAVTTILQCLRVMGWRPFAWLGAGQSGREKGRRGGPVSSARRNRAASPPGWLRRRRASSLPPAGSGTR